MAFEEFHKFIDDSVEQRKRLGEERGRITRAHGVLAEIDADKRSIPVWVINKLVRLKEVLTYDRD